MELPHLGQHCSFAQCKQLDFLPVSCDACQKTFCKDHYLYSNHYCQESYRKDNQVPVCPLCNRPVPIGASGQSPDVVVSRHIDNDCQSETALNRRKVYSNRCSLKGCKQKEVMPLLCDRCQKNFCLRHRHEMDHSCEGFENTGRGMTSQGAAALTRAANGSSVTANKQPKSSPQRTAMSFVGKELDRERQQRQHTQPQRLTAVNAHSLQQPGLTEDEALRRAIELSMQNTDSSTTSASTDAERRRQEELDEALARALQESERASQPSSNAPAGSSRPSSSQEKTSCSLS